MMHLQEGDRAPAFAARLPQGESVTLSQHRSHPLVLIFVRHLACLPCQEHLREVRDSLSELKARGAEVLVVSFDKDKRVVDYRSRLELPYPVASDLERTAYEAYGLTRGELLQVWHPKTLWRYIVLLLRGRKLQRPKKGDDLAQLGGDFVIDSEGRIVFVHYCIRPDDRPAVKAILDSLLASVVPPVVEQGD